MSEYRKLLAAANKLVNQAAKERAQVPEEGRNEEWNQKQYGDIKEKYFIMAQALTDEMFKTALTEAITAKRAADAKRKKSDSPLHKVDSAEKLYHLQRAELLLGGQSEENAITEYGFVASTLDDKEREFRYIYEDVMNSKVQDPSNKIRAQEEINKYKSAEEREAIKAAEEAWMIKEVNEGITNHLLYDLEQVTTGKADPPPYPYSEFIDGRTKRETNQARSTEAAAGVKQAMKDNPHVAEEDQ